MSSIKRSIAVASFIAVAASFLLCGYEFIRSPSNTLFQKAYGAENLPLVMSLVIPGTLLVLYVYGRLLSYFGPRRTLIMTTLISGLLLSACHYAIKNGSDITTIFLYVLREVYIILVIEQYWSYINSSLSEADAKKLNGPIVGIASLGAILGGYLVSELAVPLGTHSMLVFGAASTVPAAIFSDLAYRYGGEPKRHASECHMQNSSVASGGHLALGLFKSSRVLLILFFLIMVTQVMSAVLSLEFQSRLQVEIPDLDKQTAYSGGFFSLLNTFAALLQFAVAPILLKFVPVFLVQVAIPLFHLAAISYLAIAPTLASAGLAYMLFKVFDYSIFRASKEILYIPLSFSARYRAKEVIDFFGYRFSKGGISLILAIFKNAGFAIASAYTWIALASSLIWFMLVLPLFSDKKRETLAEAGD